MRVLKAIGKSAWAVWLGGAFTGFSGLKINDWEWWVFMVISILLVKLMQIITKDE